jgi:hypothetical protein
MMSTSKDRNVSLMQLQNMTSIDTSTYLPTTPILTPPQSSSGQRYASDRSIPVAEVLLALLQGIAEQYVRSVFPETTIVRPAPMFGFEDNLLHKLAGVTNLFTSNHMQERYWPVHVSCKTNSACS